MGLRYYGPQAKGSRVVAETADWLMGGVVARSSWRRVGRAGVQPHLVPGAAALPVQDGAQAPEASVGPHLHAVHRRLARLGRRALDGTHVVRGVVRPPPPKVSQVGEAQLLRLQRGGRTTGSECMM